MVNKLHIQNFQSHEDTVLVFHPGVNVIIGNTDSGKSAIIRSINWVGFGKPRGDAICSWWGGETKVTFDMVEGSISRVKHKQHNAYIINDDIEYKAFGANVPEQVLSKLNIEDVNFQPQSKNFYLLTSSPGEVAAHFNRMANLEQIDLVMKSVQSKIRATETDVNSYERSYEEQKKSFVSYAWVDTCEQAIIELETEQENLTAKQQNISKIKQLSESIKKEEENIRPMSAVLTAEKDVSNIITLEKGLSGLGGDKQGLSSIQEDIRELELEVSKLSKALVAGKHITAILENHNKLTELSKNLDTLSSQADSIETAQNQKTRYEKEIKLLEEKYKIERGDVCILCGTKHKNNETH